MKKQTETKEMRRRVAELEREVTERKRSEEELWESEGKYRLLIDNLIEPLTAYDSNGRILLINVTGARNLGSMPEDVIGKSLYDFFPDTADVYVARARRIFESGVGLEFEDEVPLPSGTRWFYSNIQPVKDTSGKVISVQNISYDITKRKRAEEELRESEDKYRTVIDHSIQGLVIAQGIPPRLIFANSSMANILGYTVEELLSLSPEETRALVHPEDQNMFFINYQDRLEGKSAPTQYEVRAIRKDKSVRWVEIFSTHIEFQGQPAVQAAYVDITERKRAEEEKLQAITERAAVIDAMGDGLITMGMDGKILSVNPAFIRLCGYTEDEFTGKDASSLIHRLIKQEDQERLSDTVVAALKGDISEKGTFSLLSRDGKEIPISATASFISDAEGKPATIIATFKDITDIKRAEVERESAARRVEALRDVAQAVSRSLELDELLNESLATVLDVMESDVGGIYLLDLQSGEFTLKAHIGVSEDTVGSIGLIKLKEKEIKRVLEWQEPVLTPFGLSTGANATRIAAAMEKEGIRAHITVPIRSRDMPVGALLLANRRERQFSADEVELLGDIGNELAVGIENALLLQRTKELSLTDELTGLYNRRHFYYMLEPEMYRTLRKGRSFCLVMLDLDGFKEYNDRMGHASGDSVLRSFAQTVKLSLRKSDTAFRYGGDEFIIVLPETDDNRARQIMDRIRARWLKLVEAKYAPLETPLGFSTGIAQFPENAEKADGLVFLADSALYYAKKEGGGRDILVSSLSAIPPEILGTATLDQVYALAATVDARDPYTYGHSGRVADIAQKIGKATGLSEKELANLYAASLLHDVGKVGVPDAILTKPGALTAEEWVAIKKHSSEGARIVGYVRGLGALVPVILHHHEWYDGTGYPDGLKGEGITLAARIVSVADAYDTMTTARPYREVVSHQEASEELRRCSGTQFDPELVEAFCRAMNGDNRP